MQAPVHFKKDYVMRIESSSLTMANSTIEYNTSGVYLENSSSHIASTTISNHQEDDPLSGFRGTGIYLVSSTAMIDVSTFLNNKLGIYIDSASLPNLLNLIFTNNSKDMEDLRPPAGGEG